MCGRGVYLCNRVSGEQSRLPKHVCADLHVSPMHARCLRMCALIIVSYGVAVLQVFF